MGVLDPTLAIFRLGFLFSLAKIDCLATKEILCCLGEPGAALEGLDVELVLETAAELCLVLAVVVVINKPAAVFLAEAPDPDDEDDLEDEDIVVLARVILGLAAAEVDLACEDEPPAAGLLTEDLTVLANEDVGLWATFGASSALSFFETRTLGPEDGLSFFSVALVVTLDVSLDLLVTVVVTALLALLTVFLEGLVRSPEEEFLDVGSV